jgi:hypothetical protein
MQIDVDNATIHDEWHDQNDPDIVVNDRFGAIASGLHRSNRSIRDAIVDDIGHDDEDEDHTIARTPLFGDAREHGLTAIGERKLWVANVDQSLQLESHYVGHLITAEQRRLASRHGDDPWSQNTQLRIENARKDVIANAKAKGDLPVQLAHVSYTPCKVANSSWLVYLSRFCLCRQHYMVGIG